MIKEISVAVDIIIDFWVTNKLEDKTNATFHEAKATRNFKEVNNLPT